jgi:mevalonate kinase
VGAGTGTGPLTAFGPGKVILIGEHAAVYGHPVLAGPLSLGVTATGVPSRRCELAIPPTLQGARRRLLARAFDRAARECGRPPVRVSLRSDLPVSMGLGSSAAVGVACARLLLQAGGAASASPAQVARIAMRMEEEFHGQPSGIDHTTSAQNRLILFRRRPGAEAGVARKVTSPRPLRLLVALAGPRPATRATVAALRERTARWPVRYHRLMKELGVLAREGAAAIESGDLPALGDAMNAGHGILCALGLSSAGIDGLVHRVRALGALGAKLTGAGGDGGAVIGLFYEPEPAVAALLREGAVAFASHLAGPRAL